MISKAFLLLSALLLAAVPARADDAALARLKADLAGRESATQLLTRWCGDLGLASPAHIRGYAYIETRPPQPGCERHCEHGPASAYITAAYSLCAAHIYYRRPTTGIAQPG
jgi:hypothetical protein